MAAGRTLAPVRQGTRPMLSAAVAPGLAGISSSKRSGADPAPARA